MKYITKPNSSELAEFDPKLVSKIAKDWVNISAKIKGHENVMIYGDIGAKQLMAEVAKLCAKKGCRVWYRVREYAIEVPIIANSNEKNLTRYYSFLDNEVTNADVVFLIRAPKSNEPFGDVPDEKLAKYNLSGKPVLMDYRVNYTNWQLLYWPTPAQAEIDNMPFEEYVELFFNACNQPWKEIEKAQQTLVDILDKGEKLTLIANPNDKDESKRTHLEMSIKDMTFVNSTIARNFPGSEVFSAPVKTSVNGKLYGDGVYPLGHSGKTVKNIRFEIKDGHIVKATADEGEKDLNAMLDRDEGARYFGEVAFGTNPALRRRLFNSLLNEKVGGSFHITPGKAYEDTDIWGAGRHTFNGNMSSIHWDITIMMLPKYGGGEVIVDGKTISKNGKFVVDGLEILNKGLEE